MRATPHLSIHTTTHGWRRVAGRAAALVFLALGAGCTIVLGVDGDFHEGTGGSSSSTSSGAGGKASSTSSGTGAESSSSSSTATSSSGTTTTTSSSATTSSSTSSSSGVPPTAGGPGSDLTSGGQISTSAHFKLIGAVSESPGQNLSCTSPSYQLVSGIIGTTQ
jgi:hypothetical protein